MLRTGVDLIEIARLEAALQRHGDRLMERIFTEREKAEIGDRLESIAGRFAAKEAVAKAFCTGIGDIRWREIEILRGTRQEPVLHLRGNAKKLARELGLTTWSLSLSHTATHAIAFVVAVGDLQKDT